MIHAYRDKSRRFLDNRELKTTQNTQKADPNTRTALVLGGGAPNSALMAGALAAFEDEGVSFDVVSASGAGGLVGLLWLAPKNGTPAEALRNWVNAYVADPIYNLFPVDYKIFFKPGPAAQHYRNWLSGHPAVQAVTEHGRSDHDGSRLWADWWHLVWSSFSPSSLNWQDGGLCARVPWVEDLIDFDRLKDIAPYFYLNAYNITHSIIDDFPKEEITPDHFRAAFAFPFIYGPYHLNGCDYYEGASRVALNFRDLTEKHPNLESIVVLDMLGADALIRKPRNLYDSWVLSMIVPLVSIAESDLELFVHRHNHGWRRSDGAKSDLFLPTFDIPDEHMEHVLDWSYSNGKRLFDIGYRSAMTFLDGEGAHLRGNARHKAAAAATVTAPPVVEPPARKRRSGGLRQLLPLFNHARA